MARCWIKQSLPPEESPKVNTGPLKLPAVLTTVIGELKTKVMYFQAYFSNVSCDLVRYLFAPKEIVLENTPSTYKPTEVGAVVPATVVQEMIFSLSSESVLAKNEIVFRPLLTKGSELAGMLL